ncbi:phosphoglycerate mutase family protein [Rheinheimera sp.]|uniref:SixA phosphatase family protein n=1 Tax=Rheinheimera sp. TaxID=1869214 RepID=UPI00307E0670
MKKLIVLLSVATCLQLQAWPEQIVVVRHAEKEAGKSDPHLSLCGQQQAKAMAALLNVPLQQVWHSGLNRTRETAALMASTWPDATQHSYPPADFGPVINALQQSTETTLIAGHSNTVPELLSQLSSQPAPELTEQDYGQVFVLTRKNAGYQWQRLSIQQPDACRH